MSPVMGPSTAVGAVNPFRNNTAKNVVVFQLPSGKDITRRWPVVNRQAMVV